MNAEAYLEGAIKDAIRYKALKEIIRLEEREDRMTWACMDDWCVDVSSLGPRNLDEAIDDYLLRWEEKGK